MKVIIPPDYITQCIEKNGWTPEELAGKAKITLEQIQTFNAGGEFLYTNKALLRLVEFLNQHCSELEK